MYASRITKQRDDVRRIQAVASKIIDSQFINLNAVAADRERVADVQAAVVSRAAEGAVNIGSEAHCLRIAGISERNQSGDSNQEGSDKVHRFQSDLGSLGF